MLKKGDFLIFKVHIILLIHNPGDEEQKGVKVNKFALFKMFILERKDI